MLLEVEVWYQDLLAGRFGRWDDGWMDGQLKVGWVKLTKGCSYYYVLCAN